MSPLCTDRNPLQPRLPYPWASPTQSLCIHCTGWWVEWSVRWCRGVAGGQPEFSAASSGEWCVCGALLTPLTDISPPSQHTRQHKCACSGLSLVVSGICTVRESVCTIDTCVDCQWPYEVWMLPRTWASVARDEALWIPDCRLDVGCVERLGNGRGHDPGGRHQRRQVSCKMSFRDPGEYPG